MYNIFCIIMLILMIILDSSKALDHHAHQKRGEMCVPCV